MVTLSPIQTPSPDLNRLLRFKALLHHGNIRPRMAVIACDDRAVFSHHYICTDLAGAMNSGIKPDPGVISQGYLWRKISMTLNIHMLSAVAQHQPAAKASQLSLSDLEAGIGRREMLRHSIIQQRSYLSFYFMRCFHS